MQYFYPKRAQLSYDSIITQDLATRQNKLNNLNNLIQELLVLTSLLNNLYDENIFSAYHSNMWCQELRRKINEFIIPNIISDYIFYIESFKSLVSNRGAP